jgi:hypothetical protein
MGNEAEEAVRAEEAEAKNVEGGHQPLSLFPLLPPFPLSHHGK